MPTQPTKSVAEPQWTFEDFDLAEWLRLDTLPLSRAAMRAVGPASQTLGVLYSATWQYIQKREIFFSAASIAEKALLPIETVRNHLAKVIDQGWIINRGRGKCPTGQPRRTPTLALTKQAIELEKPFCVLPRWAAHYFDAWADRAIVAVLASQHLLVETIEDGGVGCAEGRETTNARTIERFTGLGRRAVIQAKHRLAAAGVISIEPGECEWGQADSIRLNLDWRPKARKKRPRRAPKRDTVPPCKSDQHPRANLTIDPVQICPTPRANLTIALNTTSDINFREQLDENNVVDAVASPTLFLGHTNAEVIHAGPEPAADLPSGVSTLADAFSGLGLLGPDCRSSGSGTSQDLRGSARRRSPRIPITDHLPVDLSLVGAST